MSRPVRIVVALGGNALEDKGLPPTAESQAIVVERTAKTLADLSCGGYEMAVVHGNGPQVGRIILASEAAAEQTPAMPFDVCDAMSQGYIGYHLQQKLRAELLRRGRDIPVVTVVTQMVVDANDPAFENPSPSARFMTKKRPESCKRRRATPCGRMPDGAGGGWWPRRSPRKSWRSVP